MIDEKELIKIAGKFGTPIYVFDINELKKTVKNVKQILGRQIRLCYAMKANPFMIKYLESLVDKFEVCSPGEYLTCRKEKIPTKKLVLSGVYKSDLDIDKAFSDRFEGVYTVESLEQYTKMCDYAMKYHQEVNVLLRLTSGNQFGLDKDDIYKIISMNTSHKFVNIAGIHFFSGTQKKNIQIAQKELEELDLFCDGIEKKYGLKIKHIEYGAGLFFDYFNNKEENYTDVEYLSKLLREYSSKRKFTIELGRFLCASCGQYMTSVVDTKTNQGKNYCIVDGGIHQLNYYGQMLGIKVPSVQILHRNIVENMIQKWNVCGSLCTVHDVLLRDYETEKVQKGDFFVFNNSGAYSVTEASFLFLSRDLPKLVAVEDEFELIREAIPSYNINSRYVE